jgi:hypothetical protein
MIAARKARLVGTEIQMERDEVTGTPTVNVIQSEKGVRKKRWRGREKKFLAPHLPLHSRWVVSHWKSSWGIKRRTGWARGEQTWTLTQTHHLCESRRLLHLTPLGSLQRTRRRQR